MLIGFSFFMIIRKSTRCITAIKELDFGLIVQVAYIKIISNELRSMFVRFQQIHLKTSMKFLKGKIRIKDGLGHLFKLLKSHKKNTKIY